METPSKFVANKQLIVRGVTYSPGDTFDPNTIPRHKFEQFLRQRLIRPSYDEANIQPT